MKAYKYILIILTIFVITSACEDRLIEEPFSTASSAIIPNSENEANLMVLGIYDRMTRNESFRWSLTWGLDVITDDIWIRRNPSRELDQIGVFNINSFGQRGVSQPYAELYNQIFRATSAIEAFRGRDFDGLGNHLGEALTLRALGYFYLVRLYGKVALIKSLDDALIADQISRSEVSDVYDFIIADLEEAITVMGSASEARLGRPGVGAARTLLAYVHLTLGNWADAITQTQAVISSGDYALFANYRDIHDVEHENGIEHILSIQFSDSGSGGHSLQQQFMGPEDWKPTIGGSNQARMRPTHDLLIDIEPGDDRATAMFWNSYLTFPDNNFKTVDPTMEEEAYIHKFKDVVDYVNNVSETRDDCNIVLLRYADVLLMLAEAENELNGPTAAAYDAINQVRTRVGLPDLTGLSQTEFREALQRERRVEFFFEAKRFFDLQRWGILIETIQGMVPNPSGSAVAMQSNPQIDLKKANIQQKHYLWPIPQSALDLNPGLNGEQNPGY